MDNVDEIKEYQDARYLSSGEAAWKMLGYQMHWNYPAVEILPVHLPNQQFFMMEDGAPVDRDEVIAAGQKDDKLTGFFRLCREDERARELTYVEVLRLYRWVKGSGETPPHWAKRKRGKKRNDDDEVEGDTIGRIPMVPMGRPELYHLRLLLFHIKGPQSFESLRTSDEGEVFPTFQQACVYRGLIPNDDIFREQLYEIKETAFGPHLRRLFCTIMVYCMPSNVLALWEDPEIQRCLVEDYKRKAHAQHITEVHVNKGLRDIQQILEGMNKTMADFGLPEPNLELLENQDHLAVQEELQHNVVALEDEVREKYPTLNPEQRLVFDTVMASVESKEGKVFCLNAGGGTGKTYTLNLILAATRAKGEIALATATSGIAATLLHGGRTVHSRFKVPINLHEDSTCSMDKGTKEVCKNASLIIIDEVTMGHRHMYECLDRSLRDVRKGKERGGQLFGGLTVVFAGDWRQILPVVIKGGQAQIIEASLLRSHIWEEVEKLTLVTNMRAALAGGGQQEFAEFLDAIGTGTYPKVRESPDPSQMIIRLPQDMLFKPDLPPLPPNLTKHQQEVGALVKHVFFSGNYAHQVDQQLVATPPSEEERLEYVVSNRAVICPLNALVKDVNKMAIRQFPGEEKTYFSTDKLVEEDQVEDYGVETLNMLEPNSFPDHIITLKKGCIIMLLRNLDPTQGHCNGTRYIVKHLNRHTIEADIATGAYKGNKLFIPRLKFRPPEDYSFQFTRVQFPVRLAFGITANKSQGQTYKQVGVCLHNKPCFTHGQLYVALSRVGQRDKITISLGKDHGETGDEGECTTNVVYHQVLRDVGILE